MLSLPNHDGHESGAKLPPVTPEQARAHVRKILSSQQLANSPRLQRFLTFIAEETLAGRSAEIKESSVAIHVFDRKTSFDPRNDSVVRVEAHHLRSRLKDYYREEGAGDEVILELPVGSYVPAFQSARQPVASAAARTSRRWLTWAVICLAALACVYTLGWKRGRNAQPSSQEGRSVAVLPFLNLTGEADADYFADGFVEDVTTSLSRVPGLRVAARSSAFRFRGSVQDVREIGRELAVDAVLEGSVRKQGEKVRITAQLVNARDGYHLWSSNYERGIVEVGAVADDVVRSTAHVLEPGLKGLARPGGGHQPLPEARNAYWKGSYLRSAWQPQREKSLPYFEEAIRIDPDFGDAWAALAATHATMAFHLEGPVEEHYARSGEAARRALELDETIAETHVALASLHYSHDHDWPAAEREFRRAIELNPNYAYARRGFSVGLLTQARFDEALDQLKTCSKLDPLVQRLSNEIPLTLYCSRRFDEAIREARKILEADSKRSYARVIIGSSLVEMGDAPNGILELEKAAVEMGRGWSILGRLGNACARAGRTADVQGILKELKGQSDSTSGTNVPLAFVYAGLGERQRAIDSIRRAAVSHETDVNFIGVEPILDPLRQQPGFQELAKQLALPLAR
jgi:TolB-like protein/tetratricopeptide (TPR) repeat protein